jgi:hypothetical protein
MKNKSRTTKWYASTVKEILEKTANVGYTTRIFKDKE